MIVAMLCAYCAVISGCLRKAKTTLIHTSLAPYSEESEGVLYVVSGNIESAIKGQEKDTLATRNVAGYLLIHQNDWAVMIRELRLSYEERGILPANGEENNER